MACPETYLSVYRESDVPSEDDGAVGPERKNVLNSGVSLRVTFEAVVQTIDLHSQFNF